MSMPRQEHRKAFSQTQRDLRPQPKGPSFGSMVFLFLLVSVGPFSSFVVLFYADRDTAEKLAEGVEIAAAKAGSWTERTFGPVDDKPATETTAGAPRAEEPANGMYDRLATPVNTDELQRQFDEAGAAMREYQRETQRQFNGAP